MSIQRRMPLFFSEDMFEFEVEDDDNNTQTDPQDDDDSLPFDNNGLGYLPDGTRCEVTETLNGKFELVIDYPINGRYFDSEHIKVGNIIYSPYNPYLDFHQWEPFQIYRITKPHNGLVTIYAEHRSYELQGYPCLPNTEHEDSGGSAANFLSYLQEQAKLVAVKTGLPAYKFNTDISMQKNWTITRPMSIWDLMNEAVKLFGGEWEIRGQKCYLYQRRGENRGTFVRYGTNLISLTQDEESDTYSHIMPFWTDGTETVYVTDYYLQCPNENSEIRKKRVKILDMSSAFETKPSAMELQNAAMLTEEYLNPPKIEINQKVAFVPRNQTVEYAHLFDTDVVYMGDTVGVIARPLNISSEARCIQTVYDVYRGMYKSVTLGVVKATLTGTLKETSTIAKNGVTVWVSPNEPTEGFKSGDYWIRIDNTTARNAQALGRREGSVWKLLCKYGTSSGSGLTVNIAHALVVEKEAT